MPKNPTGSYVHLYLWWIYSRSFLPLKSGLQRQAVGLNFQLGRSCTSVAIFFCPNATVLYLSRAFDPIDVIFTANSSPGCSKQHQHPKSHSRCQEHQVIHSRWFRFISLHSSLSKRLYMTSIWHKLPCFSPSQICNNNKWTSAPGATTNRQEGVIFFFSDFDVTMGGIGIFKLKVGSLASFVGVTVESVHAEDCKRTASWGSLQRTVLQVGIGPILDRCVWNECVKQRWKRSLPYKGTCRGKYVCAVIAHRSAGRRIWLSIELKSGTVECCGEAGALQQCCCIISVEIKLISVIRAVEWVRLWYFCVTLYGKRKL